MLKVNPNCLLTSEQANNLWRKLFGEKLPIKLVFNTHHINSSAIDQAQPFFHKRYDPLIFIIGPNGLATMINQDLVELMKRLGII